MIEKYWRSSSNDIACIMHMNIEHILPWSIDLVLVSVFDPWDKLLRSQWTDTKILSDIHTRIQTRIFEGLKCVHPLFEYSRFLRFNQSKRWKWNVSPQLVTRSVIGYNQPIILLVIDSACASTEPVSSPAPDRVTD